VNLFVPGAPARDQAALQEYVAGLAGEAAALGTELGPGTWDDDGFGAKVELLLADPPPLVSFTFGCPPVGVVAAFQAAATPVVITVTSPQEASLAEQAGVDGLCLQGMEAGAHRGTFTNDDGADPELPLLDLLTEVRRQTDLPLIGAGGIAGPDEVNAVLVAGAVAAQAGTAFLRCPESGTSPAHQQALTDTRFTSTALTRAFSGRRARSLVNRFMREHEGAPAAYPEVNNATRPLRTAATAAGDADHMSLYAGVGYRRAAALPAGEIVTLLASGVGVGVGVGDGGGGT
jgi:nitronate monooxygenase